MWSLGLIVFGAHLFALAYLVLKSGFIPKVFGGLLLLAAACYFGSNIANLLMANYEQYKKTVDMIIGLPLAASELGLAVWLLLKGGKTK